MSDTPEGTAITLNEAVDATPAALAAAGADLHRDAAAQTQQHADRVEREWGLLLEENRTLREQHAALASRIADLSAPPPPAPEPVVIVVEPEPAPGASGDAQGAEPITELSPEGEAAPAVEQAPAEEAKKPARRKPFGRR